MLLQQSYVAFILVGSIRLLRYSCAFHLLFGGNIRPTGVTLSAYFQFLRGALVALFGLGVLFVGSISSRLATLPSEGNLIQRVLGGLGHFLGIALLLYALLQIASGISLLFLQSWARLLTILFSVFGILVFIHRTFHLRPLSTLYSLLNLAVLIYLLLPATASYFTNRGNRYALSTENSRPVNSA